MTGDWIMRRYTKPTEQAKAAAMAYLVTRFANLPIATRNSA